MSSHIYLYIHIVLRGWGVFILMDKRNMAFPRLRAGALPVAPWASRGNVWVQDSGAS